MRVSCRFVLLLAVIYIMNGTKGDDDDDEDDYSYEYDNDINSDINRGLRDNSSNRACVCSGSLPCYCVRQELCGSDKKIITEAFGVVLFRSSIVLRCTIEGETCCAYDGDDFTEYSDMELPTTTTEYSNRIPDGYPTTITAATIPQTEVPSKAALPTLDPEMETRPTLTTDNHTPIKVTPMSPKEIPSLAIPTITIPTVTPVINPPTPAIPMMMETTETSANPMTTTDKIIPRRILPTEILPVGILPSTITTAINPRRTITPVTESPTTIPPVTMPPTPGIPMMMETTETTANPKTTTDKIIPIRIPPTEILPANSPPSTITTTINPRRTITPVTNPPATIPPTPATKVPECGKQHNLRDAEYFDDDTARGEFSWMAALLNSKRESNSQFICGASILSPYLVLTAAHCVQNVSKEDILIRAGAWNLADETEATQNLKVASISRHPKYSYQPIRHDIALLETDGQFHLGDDVSTICFPKLNMTTPIKKCIATGWGSQNYGDSTTPPKELKQTKLPIVSNKECVEKLRVTKLGFFFRLHNSFMCAGGEGSGMCKGDGGSPLFCEVDGSFYQYGIASWGIGCFIKGLPDVFADVRKSRQWLKKEMKRIDERRSKYR